VSSFSKLQTCVQINKNTKVKKKHFIFIIQNNNKNRKHIKIKNKKHKSFQKKLKHEPNIVEITHLCIRHGVQTNIYIYIYSGVHPSMRAIPMTHPKVFFNITIVILLFHSVSLLYMLPSYPQMFLIVQAKSRHSPNLWSPLQAYVLHGMLRLECPRV